MAQAVSQSSLGPAGMELAGLGAGPDALQQYNEAGLADELDLIHAAQEEAHRHRQLSRKKSQKRQAEIATKVIGFGDGQEENFWERLSTRMEQMGLEPPTVTIEYNNLTVETTALVGDAGIPTVGNIPKSWGKAVMGSTSNKKDMQILKNLKGVLQPGRMTLLLGPPAAGKSTFLKVLGGRMKPSPRLRVAGEVKYNGHTAKDFIVERTTAFVNQLDFHIANLTVEETLSFAHICQTGMAAGEANLREQDTAAKGDIEKGEGPDSGVKEEDLEALVSQTWSTGVKLEIIMRVLGLQHCRHTFVGDALTRGISGGERKRVTTGEMVVGPRRVLLMDEISTGLDSATLFSVIKFFSSLTRGLKLTTVVSLLQPPPEVFFLFDDVLLMTEGFVVYHGPVRGVTPFFEMLGFACPPRKDLPSYLLEVTTPSGQITYATPELKKAKHVRDGCVPAAARKLIVSLPEMEKRFWAEDPQGQAMASLLARPFDASTGHPAALERRRYALAPLQAVKLVTARQVLLVLRDKVLLRGRIVQVIIIGLLVGSLFYQTPITPSGARTFFGAAFMNVLFMAMGSMPQLAILLTQKKIWHKHRDNNFYPPYAQGLALAFSQLPLSFLDAALYSVVTYFMIGFYTGAGYFFLFYCIMASTSLVMSAIFRFVAIAAPNPVKANAFGGLTILILILTSGFAIVRTSIPPWWIWAYWLSPFAWSLRSIVINEMTSPAWDLPSFQPGVTMGEASLQSFGFYTDPVWVWTGIIYNLALFLVMTLVSVVVMRYTADEQPVARIADEAEIEKARSEAEARRTSIAHSLSGMTPAGLMQPPAIGGAHAPPPRPSNATRADPPSVAIPPITNGPAPTSLSSPFAAAAMAPPDLAPISSSLPFTPITVVWKDIRYFVPNPGYKKGGCGPKKKPAAPAASKKEEGDVGTKGVSGGMHPSASQASLATTALEAEPELQLLKGLSGYAEPGVLMALMGGSGAGKTTLMDVICGRKTIGRIVGEIFVNGHLKVQATWSRVVGYVEQMDIHTSAQTVVEALWFSARLRLPPSISDTQVRAYVEEVMDIVDLTDIQFQLVGDPGGVGLAVEQRKRLTIAVEMVSNPSVVFMDEPTSGLDARAAAVVMRAVRNVARNGRTVMVTIHQPSIEIFEAFDMLLLMQRGGRTTYFGPLGHESVDLVAYLEAVPGTHPLPAGYNPATWMLEVTGGSMATLTKANDVDWPSLFEKSELAASVRHKCDDVVARDAKHQTPLALAGLHAQPFTRQFKELLWKYWLAYWRTPSYNFTRLVITLIVSLIYGTTYLGIGNIDPNEVAQPATVQNVMGILFSSTNFLGMTNLMSVMPIVGFERVVFYRERGASIYDAFAYGFAIAAVEMPYLFMQAVLFVPIAYWMIDFQHSAEKFFYYFIMFIASTSFYTIFGQFLVYVTPSQQIAQVVGAGLNFLMNMFNGFVITYPSMPVYWHWLNRIVPTTWVLYGLSASQLGDIDTPLQYGATTTTVSQFLTYQFGYEYDMRWWCILIVWAFVLFFRVTSILALKYWNFLRR